MEQQQPSNRRPFLIEAEGESAAPPRRRSWWRQPAMRYPNQYVWLVMLSALDIMLTHIVLYGWGGSEANPLAAAIIAERGLAGAILYKFALIVGAIVVCEWVGRQREPEGRRLSFVFLVIGAFPVIYTFLLLLRNPLPIPLH